MYNIISYWLKYYRSECKLTQQDVADLLGLERSSYTYYETGKTTSELSDKISKDLKKKGMKFVGSTIIYSYLQAIGIIYSHDEECFMFNKLESSFWNL